jgi:hypothetical protein
MPQVQHLLHAPQMQQQQEQQEQQRQQRRRPHLDSNSETMMGHM